MKNIFKIFLAILIPQVVGIIGGLFTVSSIPSWYQTLNKPFFSPPNWIFGPVWTLLYLTMGIASYLVWKKGLEKNKVRVALYFYLAQLVLNFFWSIIFFGWRLPLWAFLEIIILWFLILMTMIKFYNLSKPAGYLLLPYLFWVSFAAILNLSIVVLN